MFKIGRSHSSSSHRRLRSIIGPFVCPEYPISMKVISHGMALKSRWLMQIITSSICNKLKRLAQESRKTSTDFYQLEKRERRKFDERGSPRHERKSDSARALLLHTAYHLTEHRTLAQVVNGDTLTGHLLGLKLSRHFEHTIWK